MEWAQFLILILTIGGLFLWNRSESRSDYRHLEAGVKAQLDAIHSEIKDFHGRLCAIEERNKEKK